MVMMVVMVVMMMMLMVNGGGGGGDDYVYVGGVGIERCVDNGILFSLMRI